MKIENGEIYILHEDGNNIGWLRYGHFWDNTPFLNIIWIDEQYRGKDFGKQVVRFWEGEMKHRGFKLVMTSTLANESAQHFYRKLGYRDAGCLLLEGAFGDHHDKSTTVVDSCSGALGQRSAGQPYNVSNK